MTPAALFVVALAGCRTAEPPLSTTTDVGAMDASAPSEPPYAENPLLPSSLWKPLPGLPHDCPDRVAIDPKAAMPPLAWRPCASGQATCERADAEWSPLRYGGVYIVDPEPVRRINGAIRISYVRQEWRSYGKYDRRVSVVADGAGTPVFALGDVQDANGHTCAHGRYAGSRGIVVDGIPPRGDTQYLLVSSWQRPSELDFHRLTRDAFAGVPPYIYPRLTAWGPSGALFVSTNAPPSTAIYDFDHRLVTLAKEPTGSGRLDALAYVGLDDGALTMTQDGDGHPLRMGFIDALGAHTPLFQAPSGRAIIGMTVDRGATAPQIVWIEAAYELGDFTSTEIWTSPAAKTAAGIQRRLVAKDSFGAGFTLAAVIADRGLAFFKNGLQSARLVRLADGKGWVIPADTDHNVSEVMGITDDSVWMLVSKRDSVVQDVTMATGIQRVRLDSLGEPTVPNGL